MSCHETRSRIHDYLDRELTAREMVAVRSHLEECPQCRLLHEDLVGIREYLSRSERLPQLTGEELWRRIHRRTHRSWGMRLADQWQSVRAFWRDLDRRLMWSRIGAVPITLAFFVLIGGQFPGVDFQEWDTTVLTQARASNRQAIVHMPVRMRNSQIEDLVSEVWKMPFEDSLSLLAEITPEGHAEIGDVLEYPRSEGLLRAVDVSLRGSQFDTRARGDGTDSVLIYSFQKVDVYEGY